MKRFVRYSLFLILYSVMIFAAPKIMAFTGPTCTAPGSCSLLTASGTWLGIGTSNPGYTLEVDGGGNAWQNPAIVIKSTSAGFGPNLRLDSSATGLFDWALYQAGSSDPSTLGSFNIFNNSRGNALTILSGGNVGIATTTPGYPLTVSGNIYTSGAFIGALSGGLSAVNISSDVFGRLQGNGNFAFPASLGVATTTQNGLPQALSVYGGGYFTGSVGIGTTNPATVLDVQNTGGTGYIDYHAFDGGTSWLRAQLGSNSYNGELNLYDSNSSEQVHISSNGNSYINQGNVGIGTTGPAVKFDVRSGVYGPPATSGTSQSTGAMRLEGNDNGVLDFGEMSSSNPGAWWLQATDKTNLGLKYQLLLNPNGGNVGIGTATPLLPLDVAMGAGTGGSIKIGNSGAAAFIGEDNSGAYWGSNIYVNSSGWNNLVSANPAGMVYLDNNGAFQFYTRAGSASPAYGTSKMTILNGGNVGIGTTAPAYPLTVNGQIASLSGGIVFPDGSVQTTAYQGSSQQTNAAYVTQGTFGSSVSGSNNQYYIKPTTDTTAAFGVQNSGGTSVLDVDTSNQRVGIGTAGPGYKLTVSGGSIGGNYGLTPNYASWSAYGTGDGGAAIYNDNGSYKTLMIVGNNSGGGSRQVGVWDYLTVNGGETVTSGFTVNGASTFNNQVTINGNLNMGTNSISMSTASSSITVNKLNVNTIDPIYSIGGQNYATYGPDIIGLNTEDFGKGTLQNGEYVIDFKNAPKGSDLWLFWQTINEGPGMQNIIVTLTPQGGQASLWYDLNPAAEQIVVHGNKDVAFSYHLVAPRYDSAKWGNLTESPPGATLPVK